MPRFEKVRSSVQNEEWAQACADLFTYYQKTYDASWINYEAFFFDIEPRRRCGKIA